MYNGFFHLTTKPFDLLPNPDFLYLSKSHRSALTALDYALHEQAGFILLTGDVGAGKTTLIRNLVRKRGAEVMVSRVFNSAVTSTELLALINDDFGLPDIGRDKVTLLRQLNTFLIEQYALGRTPLVIIDEAQRLSFDALEEVRMLSNLESDSAKLLRIILAGQPELRDTLAQPALLQLRQRISYSAHLSPLEPDEVGEYILHRLEIAGNRNAVAFDPGALEHIHYLSHGIPRLINIICDYLLLAAFSDGSRVISAESAREVFDELDLELEFWGKDSPATGTDAPTTGAPAGATTGESGQFAELKRMLAETILRVECLEKKEQLLMGELMKAIEERREVPVPNHHEESRNPDHPESPTSAFPERRSASLEAPNPATGAAGKRHILAHLRKWLHLSCFVGVFALFSISGVRSAQARDFTFTPALTISEEFNDNIFESVHNRESDMITHVNPTFSLLYGSSLWDWKLGYSLDYRHFARTGIDNVGHTVNLNGDIRVIDNFFFIKVSDTYSRVSINSFRDTTQENYLVGQTDMNDFAITPYFTLRPTPKLTLTPGYTYRNVWYSDSYAISRQEHGPFLKTEYELTPKLFITSDISYTWVLGDQGLSYTRFTPTAGFRYYFANNSYVFANGGASRLTPSSGSSVISPYWSAGITRAFSNTVVALTSSVTYDTDLQRLGSEERNVSASLTRQYSRGSARFSLWYSDVINSISSSQANGWKYGGSGALTHNFSEKLQGHLEASLERLGWGVDGSSNGTSYRYNFGTGVTYQMPHEMSAGLHYYFSSFQSGLWNSDNNLYTNRVVAMLTKRF